MAKIETLVELWAAEDTDKWIYPEGAMTGALPGFLYAPDPGTVVSVDDWDLTESSVTVEMIAYAPATDIRFECGGAPGEGPYFLLEPTVFHWGIGDTELGTREVASDWFPVGGSGLPDALCQLTHHAGTVTFAVTPGNDSSAWEDVGTAPFTPDPASVVSFTWGGLGLAGQINNPPPPPLQPPEGTVVAFEDSVVTPGFPVLDEGDVILSVTTNGDRSAVVLFIQHGATFSATCTYNGVALEQVATTANNEIWGLLDAPAGTHDLVISGTDDGSGMNAGAYVFSGVASFGDTHATFSEDQAPEYTFIGDQVFDSSLGDTVVVNTAVTPDPAQWRQLTGAAAMGNTYAGWGDPTKTFSGEGNTNMMGVNLVGVPAEGGGGSEHPGAFGGFFGLVAPH